MAEIIDGIIGTGTKDDPYISTSKDDLYTITTKISTFATNVRYYIKVSGEHASDDKSYKCYGFASLYWFKFIVPVFIYSEDSAVLTNISLIGDWSLKGYYEGDKYVYKHPKETLGYDDEFNELVVIKNIKFVVEQTENIGKLHYKSPVFMGNDLVKTYLNGEEKTDASMLVENCEISYSALINVSDNSSDVGYFMRSSGIRFNKCAFHLDLEKWLLTYLPLIDESIILGYSFDDCDIYIENYGKFFDSLRSYEITIPAPLLAGMVHVRHCMLFISNTNICGGYASICHGNYNSYQLTVDSYSPNYVKTEKSLDNNILVFYNCNLLTNSKTYSGVSDHQYPTDGNTNYIIDNGNDVADGSNNVVVFDNTNTLDSTSDGNIYKILSSDQAKNLATLGLGDDWTIDDKYDGYPHNNAGIYVPPVYKPMILNDALDVYLGPYPVSRVYMGDYLIWQRLTMPYMEGVQNYYDCRRGVGNPEDPNDKNWHNLVSDQYPMQLTSVNVADDGSVRFWGPYKAEDDDDPNPGTTVNTVHGAFISPESDNQTVYIVYKVCAEYGTPVETDGILMSSKEHTSETDEEPVTELIGVTPYANVRYTYKDLYGDESVGIIDAQYYEASYNEYCVVAFKKDTNSGLTLVRSFLNGKLLGLGVANEVLGNGKFWGVCGKGKEWLESDKNHEDAPLQNVNSNNIGFPEINVKMIAVANVAHSDEKILQNCRFLMDQYNTADDMANFAPMDGLEFNGSQIVDTHFVIRNGLMGAKNPWVRIIVKLQNYESGGVYGNYEDGRYAPTLGACFIGSGNYGYMYAGLGKDTLWKSAYYDIKPNDSSVWECTMSVNLQTRQVNLSYKNKSLTSYYKIDPDHPTTTLLEKAIQLGYSDGVTGSSNLKATVLSFQIKDGTGKLLVDMVPMKRRSGGQLGMYDRACSKFRALTDI